MQSKELQVLTASEPLTLEEEYTMQQSWLHDENKCTFIVLDKEKCHAGKGEIDSMVGDVNLFFDAENMHSAEVEIMIAEDECRGRGFGKEALLLMMRYAIVELSTQRFTAKIGEENLHSLSMFKKLGFMETSRSKVFREVTLEIQVTVEFQTWLLQNTECYQLDDRQKETGIS
ncbi:PREDICTED: N-acetyltransferase 9-like protein [Priapulus caudatus]|uniref:N-acetyltransferase 9-like protein n=1 Tax=Priapulus caudatus TaxID=37621 RepID=A0ABM1ERG2_PRICU|nr:PREDICTED: N-acetyltransferase 9-like protein [Priapulus caudatus]